MIRKLHLLFLLICAGAVAQDIEIAGDTMLCPGGSGTAYVTTDTPIDYYQWMSRDWGSGQEFQAIEGANGPTFTYSSDAYTLKEIRLFAIVLGDIQAVSNILLIDGYVFMGITTQTNLNDSVSINPNDGSLMLCPEGSFTVQVLQPYTTSIQWFLNGVPLAGNSATLEIAAPGDYWVQAAPQVCPDYLQVSLPITVTADPNCELGLPDTAVAPVFLFPNPVQDELHFRSKEGLTAYTVFDLTGKRLLSGPLSGTIGNIDVSGVSSGVYLLKLESTTGSLTRRIVKEY